jgi:hypothetical protein
MEFYEFRRAISDFKTQLDDPDMPRVARNLMNDGKYPEFLECIADSIQRQQFTDEIERATASSAVLHLQMESLWECNRRPFLNCWPIVLQTANAIPDDATFRAEFALPEAVIALRFRQGLVFGDRELVGAFVGKHDFGTAACAVFRDSYTDYITHAIQLCEADDDITWMPSESERDDFKRMMRFVVKLAITTGMLSTDVEWAERVILATDAGRLSEAKLTVDEALSRAKSRGRYGWEFGKEQESHGVNPHWRRPHWGIRHTGKGGTIPKLVPVKGCIVEKKFDIPTDFDDTQE